MITEADRWWEAEERFAGVMTDAFRPVLEQIDEVRRLCERRDPVIVKLLVARDDVPRRRAYRMWDTRGELTVYVSWRLIDALWRRPGQTLEGTFYGYPFSIPVVYEEAA